MIMQMSTVQSSTEYVTMESLTCCTCGILFAMPADVRKRFRESGNVFHCPNGHQQCYGVLPEVERLKQEVARQQAAREQAEARAADEAQKRVRAQNRLAESRAAMERLRKRAANGVCIHCNRSFTDLRRHMASKHPEAVGAASCSGDVKTCTKCKVAKPRSEFYRMTAAKDGLQYHCKACLKAPPARPEAEDQ